MWRLTLWTPPGGPVRFNENARTDPGRGCAGDTPFSEQNVLAVLRELPDD